jgi:hypothetical protein
MKKYNISLLSAFACLGVLSCKRNTADINAQERLTYSVRNPDGGEGILPLKWAVAGQIKTNCNGMLGIPQDVANTLAFAWSKANDLLETPLDMLVNQAQGDFFLNNVSLVLSSERVLVFNGCIGSKGDYSGAQPSSQMPQVTQMLTTPSTDGGISSSCEELSDVILNLKKPDKIMNPASNCGNPALVAGFALRSSARDVKLTAYFKHKGFSGVYKMPDFEINTIELKGTASASITSFGSALLPLPPSLKQAATVVMERLGSGALSMQAAQAKTVIPDATVRTVNHSSGVGTTRISKLSENIARYILKPACEDAAEKLGTFSKDKCKIREYTGGFGPAEALEEYRSMTVVNCESKGFADLGKKYLYALAHKPNVQAGETDFLVYTGSKPSQLSVYHKESGPVGSYAHKAWTTYIGPSDDQSKCGKFDSSKFRCITVVSGSTEDGGGFCGNGIHRKLSMLSSPKID